MLVDSHCHLNFPDFAEDLDAVVARAREAGVGVMQTICTEMEEFDQIAGIAERYAGIYCSVGVHPNDSEKVHVPSLEELLEKTKHPKTIGIGETGLDYYYEKSDRSIQQLSFRTHIHCAQASGLPLIVHTRSADEDTVAILREEMARKPFSGVIHCFSASLELAEQALELGFYISFSGIVTFKNASIVHEAARRVPLDRVLVETDSPFLAPVPHRGKRNEPGFTREVNKSVAALKAISEEECAAGTTANFFRLFSKAKPV